jgi:hypothetical protein
MLVPLADAGDPAVHHLIREGAPSAPTVERAAGTPGGSAAITRQSGTLPSNRAAPETGA